MSGVACLDTGPLGLLAQRPGKSVVVDACQQWLRDLLTNAWTVYVPEISDYEVRRELVRVGQAAGISRLDALITTLDYVPISTSAMRKAADLWAQARNGGWSTADPHALDGDVVLAAQMLTLEPSLTVPIVATANVSHLARYLSADLWQNIYP